ncbi:MAG: phosphonate C-P lyase system protein PhnH [Propionibacteriaceae bacterium]|nr:phosphonate C-P lyase system protein PhnH [Propionibacteriaceae bacterium]
MTTDLHPTTRTVLLDDDERQQVFRACLDALARPGKLQRMAHPLHAPIELPMLALTDLMVPVAALAGRRPGQAQEEPGSTEFDAEAAATRIAGLTRAPLTTPDSARWVLAGHDPDPARVATLAAGTAADPHLGAMLCLPVTGLAEVTGETGAAPTEAGSRPGWRTLELTGPGIRGARYLRASGISPELLATRAELTAAYPLGIDVLAISPAGDLLGLPRTTRVREVSR